MEQAAKNSPGSRSALAAIVKKHQGHPLQLSLVEFLEEQQRKHSEALVAATDVADIHRLQGRLLLVKDLLTAIKEPK